MATLNIGGQRVKVSDEFMQLSPEQQNATVEEIAASLPKQQQVPDDHGKARRDAMSVPEKIASPITEYPTVYAEMNRESRDQMSRGVGQLKEAVSGAKPLYESGGPESLWQGVKGAGNVAGGALGYLMSPLNAAFRTQVGNPVEDLTGVPREYTEFAAQLAAPGIGFGRLPTAPGAPVNPANFRPQSAAPAPQSSSSADAVTGLQALQAQERLREAGHSVDVPRTITSDSIPLQRSGEHLSNIPFVGDPLKKAFHETVPQQMLMARDKLAAEYGAGSGPNVAHRAGNVVSEGAAAETRGATDAARSSDDAVTAAWQGAHDNTMRQIGQAETRSLEQARAAVGDMSPQDMGQTLIARLRAGEQEARANKDSLYAVAERSDGAINGEAVPALRPRVAQALTDAGRTPDAALTPASHRMMEELDRFSRGGNPDVTLGATYPRQMQQVEQTRKRLNGLSQAATNDADRAAARMIVREFDGWLGDSFDNALFSGSDEALNSFRAARAANTEWRQRFGFNARDDADRIVNRIATGEVTPQEVSNWLVGASKVGSKGTSSRLLTRIAEATGGDQEALAAIRGGVWNRLSQSTEGATALPPEKVASGIYEFMHGSGRDVAQRLFTPEQQGVMRVYADTLRRGREARELTAEVAKNTKPTATTVEKGPIQQLADKVVGKGQKSDEALFSTIHGYAQKGGDVKALAGLLRELPQSMKGDLAASFVRNLGVNKAGQFTVDQFATQWQNMTPQAKAILFGNAGEHVTALNDISTIAQRMKDVKGRYGNASGTSQNSIFAALMGLIGGTVGLPAAAGTAAVSGAGYLGAKVLASPAGASSLAKHARAVERYEQTPTPQNAVVVRLSERNLVNTMKTIGATRQLPAPMQSFQGAVPARAQDEKR